MYNLDHRKSTLSQKSTRATTRIYLYLWHFNGVPTKCQWWYKSNLQCVDICMNLIVKCQRCFNSLFHDHYKIQWSSIDIWKVSLQNVNSSIDRTYYMLTFVPVWFGKVNLVVNLQLYCIDFLIVSLLKVNDSISLT